MDSTSFIHGRLSSIFSQCTLGIQLVRYIAPVSYLYSGGISLHIELPPLQSLQSPASVFLCAVGTIADVRKVNYFGQLTFASCAKFIFREKKKFYVMVNTASSEEPVDGATSSRLIVLRDVISLAGN